MDTEVIGTTTEPSTAAAPAPVQQAPAQEERTFRQSELNEIVGRVRQEERAKQKPAYTEPAYGNNSYNQQPVAPQGNTMGESDLRRIAAEEAQRLRNEWVADTQSKMEAEQAQRIVKNFWDKVNTGKEKYQDFDQVTGNMALKNFPNVVQLLAEHVDNSGDLLYELGKNRLKLSQLENLAYQSPEDAIIEAKRLAQSIKDNEASAQIKSPQTPLSQQRPSNIGTGTGNVLSVRDYRNRYKV